MWLEFFIAFLCGVFVGNLLDQVRRDGSPDSSPRAIGLSKVDDEWELEFSDGRRYRSDTGIIWYRFPSGEQCDYYWNSWLERELKRLQLVQKWIGEH